MFQDHQTISALSCFFDAAKVLRNTRQNNPFPTTSQKNPWFWEKSGISWVKVRRKKKRKLKSKENRKKIPIFPQKSLIFSQRWEKSWESWEKLPIKASLPPHALKGQKLLAQGGHWKRYPILSCIACFWTLILVQEAFHLLKVEYFFGQEYSPK